MAAKTIKVPALTLTIDQLVAVIQQLDADDFSRVAQAVSEQIAHVSIGELRTRLAQYEPGVVFSDEELVAEVKAVRAERAARAGIGT